VLIGFLTLLVLIASLTVARARIDPAASRDAWAERDSPTVMALGALAVVVASFPLLHLVPRAKGPATYFGDAMGHALVAAEIAEQGLPHGWIESYVGGFPFGHHYPALGWLVVAALVKVGLSPATATHWIGFVATLAAPLSLYGAAIWCGARARFAVVGSLVVAWVLPYNPFFGGYGTFFQTGLLSQVCALPLCVLLLGFVARGRARWPAVLCGTLAMAAHPQLAVATLAVGGLCVLVATQREAVSRYLRVAAASGVVGAGLYGQGLASLNVPLGWPPNLRWIHLGFHPRRLEWWLVDGDLLDRGRPAVFTALCGAAALVLLLRLRRPAARAALLALSVTLAFSVSGQALERLGSIGTALLTFLQPLRVVALIPVAAGAVVIVALQEGAPSLAGALKRLQQLRLSAATPQLLALVSLLVAAVGLPATLREAARLGRDTGAHQRAACGAALPGYDRDAIGEWLSSLQGGRLRIDPGDDETLLRCRTLDGLDHASSLPLGKHSVGAQVGLLGLAFDHLAPERLGADRRAEALGVSHLLWQGDATAPSGWSVQAQRGSMQLLAVDRPVRLVAAGCVRQRWRGTDAALRAALIRAFETPTGADALLDPQSWVALEQSAEPLRVEAMHDDCDFAQARVRSQRQRPGAFQATVESPAAVDVAIRATAFPTWRVFIDGAPSGPIRTIAPGFIAVRVSPGRHEVRAVAGTLPGYGMWVIAAVLVAIGLSWRKPPRLGQLRALVTFAIARRPR